jgi:hypothetical protein
MSDEHLSEITLIDMSRVQRMAWERLLLLTAGLSLTEAERITRLADADRSAIAAVEMEIAA